MSDFYTIDELDTKIAANQPVILNQQAEKPVAIASTKTTVKRSSKGTISEFEQRILNVLELLPNKAGKPKDVYQELQVNYPNMYDHKQISNKMWAMVKKGLLCQNESNKLYFI